MTSKVKALELYNKFLQFTPVEFEHSYTKKCALIAVDEIDDIYQKLTPKDDPYCFLLELEYWQDVKQEITKL